MKNLLDSESEPLPEALVAESRDFAEREHEGVAIARVLLSILGVRE